MNHDMTALGSSQETEVMVDELWQNATSEINAIDPGTCVSYYSRCVRAEMSITSFFDEAPVQVHTRGGGYILSSYCLAFPEAFPRMPYLLYTHAFCIRRALDTPVTTTLVESSVFGLTPCAASCYFHFPTIKQTERTGRFKAYHWRVSKR